ncbi:hypothetical protein [Natronococcus wangiae]|uniref:hypothetical protein n=1 Tax=Natronococcus wangiae TaxID=3068275 RepID=UPI00273E5078|nr:hypothetical protein [Natronococcus sp. AD5]
MKIPQPLEYLKQRGAAVHAYDDDEGAIVADFGTSDDGQVDVVGKTAIVLVGDQQFEFDLPPEANRISINSGILTITE